MRRGLKPRRSGSGRAAVLALDLISDFEFPDGPGVRRALETRAPAIRRLLEAARAKGVPVIYANDNLGAWRSDAQALMARLAEIVCHDNFTEMHAFKHHQAIVEEFHATREPWRWMHLVCGAQAAAISFGKNMTVYEEYLELLHAA